ncbi:pectate lyase-like protein [Maribacter vaceletii]|uniref:Pectate lyase-like protein n=2 Tax=Maribacter vaceletii TaxID=1206816 RepID=A0A495EC30_9FLAO|nr:pectate lyase-like protein [Maribacter vaceletii]
MRINNFVVLVALFAVFGCKAQKESVWDNYVNASKKGQEAILPNFSFAGYKYSEQPIPRVNYPVFNVVDFGAIPNDNLSDKDALNKAIKAASKKGKGIIYFPNGRYMINTGNDDESSIKVQSSHIVFRGESQANTILFFDKDLSPADPEKLWTVPAAIKVSVDEKSKVLANVTGNVTRETHSIEVDNSSAIKKGDWVILQVENNSKDLVAYDVQPLIPDPEWTALLNDGVQVNERHKVESVIGNTITFVEPIHYDVTAKHKWKIKSFPHLNHVGFEEITFEGNWTKDFVHHRSAQDDGGWTILSISNVVDSWAKDCTFKNVNAPLSFSGAAASTALNITISGKIGHSSVHAAGGSTGILIAKVNDMAGMHHAVGVAGGSSSANVIWRCKFPAHTCFESHASQPRCTLFDKVEGGFFAGRGGGARFNLPNHGRYLVLWNYKEIDEAEEDFRFVAIDSWYWRIVPPIIVGFHGSGTTFKEDEVQILESLGAPVKPESLFEEQLKLRLGHLPEWVLKEKK